MLAEEDFIEINKLKVAPGAEVNLENYPTDYEGKEVE